MALGALGGALALLALAHAAGGISCVPRTFAGHFYFAATSGAPISLARVVGNYSVSGPRFAPYESEYRGHILRVEQVYGDCAPRTPYFALVTVWIAILNDLEYGQLYLLPLNKDRTPSKVSGCPILSPPDALFKEDRAFLDSRQLCCNGVCECAGPRAAAAVTRRCKTEKPPCADATVCSDNPCSGEPEWFAKTGLPACEPNWFDNVEYPLPESPSPEPESPSPEPQLA